MAEPLILQARSAYRALLRELPRRHLSSPSPLHQRLRQTFRTPQESSPASSSSSYSASDSASSSPSESSSEAASSSPALSFSTPTTPADLTLRIQEAEQLAQYARAQRSYASLLERYNPGMSLDEEERIRLTARRVGFNLPKLYSDGVVDEEGNPKTES